MTLLNLLNQWDTTQYARGRQFITSGRRFTTASTYSFHRVHAHFSSLADWAVDCRQPCADAICLGESPGLAICCLQRVSRRQEILSGGFCVPCDDADIVAATQPPRGSPTDTISGGRRPRAKYRSPGFLPRAFNRVIYRSPFIARGRPTSRNVVKKIKQNKQNR